MAATAWRIKVSGLKGGHSGVDIHQGRGNALRILGGVLQQCAEQPARRDRRDQRRQRAERDPARGFAVVVLDAARETELQRWLRSCEAE